ncbi:zinc finger MYND domain-containing protein 10 [Octopus bimaculoides]|uniref:Zinc finger MYND domain-containing protein 10 n=1 Tax=Octopus bimaculoides TaxID=37653 RepID=A0A0L8HF05_OCTBM|nr:zinc finger MYND domain-containing protein 10 [Octopus bimaculoides]|eukprot:XP_014772813.1 PREDICTED: zinc finger MYND domain-containing protein 10-like [Octopus bimaculoides]
MTMSFSTNTRLSPSEAEMFVDSLKVFDVASVGSPEWTRQHEYVEKLNIQAILNASADEDEFVKSFLISYEKFPVLITDLLVSDVWKEKVFSQLLDMEFEPESTFPLYITLYHEATVINLLETTLYFPESCESADESLLDLVDYCYRKLTDIISRSKEKFEEIKDFVNEPGSSNMQDLEKQAAKLNFDISVKAMSIMRYVTDNVDGITLSILTRILNTHDLPILLVELLENPPWTQEIKGKTYRYYDCKWHEMKSTEDNLKLTKTEGQVWIALFNVIMKSSCQKKYEMTSYRKNILMKLRSHLTELLLDQMPALVEMRRYLEYLGHMETPAVKNELILEQIPQIRENILKKNKGKWKKLARKQSQTYFNPSEEFIRGQAKRWAETYNLDVLDELIPEPPKCAVCGEKATKRCSRCRNIWYCRRECQVSHWPKHKAVCDLINEEKSDTNTKENTKNQQ